MKKLMLVFIMLLLPLQYSWALAAGYDLHAQQDVQTHFGHHNHDIEHEDATNDATNDVDDRNVDNEKPHSEVSHQHYGFSHLSCNELLKLNLPIFTPQANIFFYQLIIHYHAPPQSSLDRPNWQAAV